MRSFAVAVSCLMACGNSSSHRPDAGGDAASGDVAADPPQVSATMPTNGEQEVLRTRALKVTFTHDMNPSTITANTFHVVAGAAVSGTVTYDAATRTATFMPGQRLSAFVTHTATLVGVTDSAGAALADFSWTFKTTEGAWSQPSFLGHYSRIERDPNGDLVGLFPQSNGDVSARVRHSGTPGFVSAATLSTTTKQSLFPEIQINAAREGMGVWVNGDISARDLWAVHYSQGTWGSPTSLESLSGDSFAAHVAVAANGDAIAVWEQVDTTAGIWANHYDHVSGWGSPEQIATVSPGTYPTVAIDSTGVAHVAWADGSVQVTRYVNSAWVTPQSIGTGGNMKMIADGSGNVTLVWLNTNIEASRWNGSSWSASTVITNGAGIASYPEVAMDGAGNLLVAYGQTVGSAYTYRDAWVTRYIVGTGWQTPELIETDSLRLEESVGVGMDAAGNAVVGWSGCVGGVSPCTVFANRYVVGTGWRGQKTLMASGWAEPMMFAFDGDGTPIAVYEDQNTAAAYTSEFQ